MYVIKLPTPLFSVSFIIRVCKDYNPQSQIDNLVATVVKSLMKNKV